MLTPGPARWEAVEYGDSGLLLTVLDADPQVQWEQVQAIAAAVRRDPPTGLVDLVAGFDTLFISFDLLVTDHTAVRAHLDGLGISDASHEPRTFDIPVVYGGEFGPDLDEVARLLDLDTAAVIALHTRSDWTVRVIGSPLGAPLLDGPELPVAVPRLDSPRIRVEPGSVGLSGHQCIIYNGASPGGWRLIGRTPLRLFDPEHLLAGGMPGGREPTASDLVPYRPGDRFRFRAIPAEQWDDLAGAGPGELTVG